MNIGFFEHYQKNTTKKKINDLFSERIKLISEYPEIGRKTNDSNIRVTLVKDYLIVYEFNSTEIIIHLIWDSRRDESKMHK